MRFIDLTLKDLRQMLRDRRTFMFLLIMPVAFTLLFGFAFGGDSAGDPRLPVALRDEDGSELSQELEAMLSNSEVVRLETDDEATADELAEGVADEDFAAAIIIPSGFGAGLLNGNGPAVNLVAGGQVGLTVEGEVDKFVSRLAGAVQAAQVSVEAAAAQGLLGDEPARQAHFDEALARALKAWETPPVSINTSTAAALAEEDDSLDYSAYAHSSPGMMAQFAIAALMGASVILPIEKKTGALQRLLTTNLSRAEILAGHFLAMFFLILLQLVVLMLFGQLFLSLPYFDQPLASTALTLATAFFAAGLGLLIGVVAKSEEQVIILAMVPMFVLSGLGGAWVPLEITPEAFQRIAFFTPLSWVVEGYKDILIRGQGLSAVATGIAVLLGYMVAFLGLAGWRFRPE
jgi:ABC-2 type transport system permease protein